MPSIRTRGNHLERAGGQAGHQCGVPLYCATLASLQSYSTSNKQEFIPIGTNIIGGLMVYGGFP